MIAMVMPVDQLNQRWMFERRTLRIESDGLGYEVEQPNRHFNTRVPFEKLSAAPSRLVLEQKSFLWAAVFFGVLGLLALLSPPRSAAYGCLGVAGACYLSFRATRRDYLVYEAGGEKYLLFRTRPSKEEVDAFLAEFEKKREEFFEKRDAVMKPAADSASEITRLVRLYRLGHIDQEEFEILKRRVVQIAELEPELEDELTN